MNKLTRFRRSTRESFRVTIFGSARLKPGSPAYDAVKQLAAELAAMGCDIVTGGGPGLMQAANEGAASVDPTALGRSVGIRVDLPFEQTLNPFVGQAYEHRALFSRLHHFMILSDAFVVVPGGRRHAARDVAGVAAAAGAQALLPRRRELHGVRAGGRSGAAPGRAPARRDLRATNEANARRSDRPLAPLIMSAARFWPWLRLPFACQRR